MRWLVERTKDIRAPPARKIVARISQARGSKDLKSYTKPWPKIPKTWPHNQATKLMTVCIQEVTIAPSPHFANLPIYIIAY